MGRAGKPATERTLTRWLLDTNAVIDAFAGRADATKALAKAKSDAAEWVGYSSMTRLEALGFSSLSAADETGLRALLAEFNEAHITPAVIEEAIRIRQTARVKIPDAIIAATALVQQADVVTRNTSDFRCISGLTVVDLAGF